MVIKYVFFSIICYLRRFLSKVRIFISIFLCFQVVVTGASHTPNKQSRIPIIQGELIPVVKSFNNKHGGTAQQQSIPTDSALYAKLPLIIVTANIDTFGLIHVSILGLFTTVGRWFE